MKLEIFRVIPLCVLLTGFGINELRAQDDPLPAWADFASGDNCTYKANPDAFNQAAVRSAQAMYRRMAAFDKQRPAVSVRAISASAVQHKNFIDDEIFSALDAAKVQPAPLSSDEEFFRRINLDLTGRIPSSADVRAFLADQNPGKRSAVIDRLLYSPEFTDKWTMWLGDLVENNATAVNVTRNVTARNAFYKFLWENVTVADTSLQDTVYKIITATGNTYDEPSPASFILGGIAPGGPADDEYDMLAYKTAKMFLGLGNYDCLMCHNGRGHLDSLNLWASGVLRTDAEHMSAFFSHERHPGYQLTPGISAEQAAFYVNSSNITELTTATSSYALPTVNGNRPNRPTVNGARTLDPLYRSGQKPGSTQWRQEYAKLLINDPMFSVNFANRLWKEMFNYGLVDQADFLDPARLDPDNPPDAPWTMQATHPVLLSKLAKEFGDRKYSLREFLRLIAESSAYQLSSRYSGDWEQSSVPLFARHYARRLDGEEIHDAVVKATQVIPKYTVQGWAATVSYAMQLPDTSEPRGNGAATFMNNFLRGNRDNVPRSGTETIGQSQSLMNDNFVVSRIKMAASPTLQAVAKLTTPAAQIEEMFYTFLGRAPSDYEKSHALDYLSKATTTAQKNAALEDLAWALVNKLEFAFSY
jgi:Protein of unknown function (DUF1553)/Protein of unknown function (DUF1549)